MRLNLFANKSKVKVLKKMLKKIEGKTGPFSPEENLHFHCDWKNKWKRINEKEKINEKEIAGIKRKSN